MASKVKDAFMKLIVAPDIQFNETGLSETLVREHRDSLSIGFAYLKAPQGNEHKVTLFYRHCGVWLNDGWFGFCHTYSLARGHVLFFYYIGKSRFKVRIYDKTPCEINYPDFGDPSLNVDSDWGDNEHLGGNSHPASDLDTKFKCEKP